MALRDSKGKFIKTSGGASSGASGGGTSKVIDRDLGYAKFMRNILAFSRVRPEILIGVRAASSDAEMVVIATANEFGTQDGHVPERSFLRSTVDENRTKYTALITKAVTVGIDKGIPALEKELGRLGLTAVGDVQKKIAATKDPPNAAATIAAKGSDNPLVNTGRLIQSIDFIVRI